jgi:hypothetical protein
MLAGRRPVEGLAAGNARQRKARQLQGCLEATTSAASTSFAASATTVKGR